MFALLRNHIETIFFEVFQLEFLSLNNSMDLPKPLKSRSYPSKNFNWCQSSKLTQGQLIEVDWHSNKQQHEDIWYDKCPTPIVVCNVREPDKIFQRKSVTQSLLKFYFCNFVIFFYFLKVFCVSVSFFRG